MTLVECRENLNKLAKTNDTNRYIATRDAVIWQLFTMGTSVNNIKNVCQCNKMQIIIVLRNMGVNVRDIDFDIDSIMPVSSKQSEDIIRMAMYNINIYDIENYTGVSVAKIADVIRTKSGNRLVELICTDNCSNKEVTKKIMECKYKLTPSQIADKFSVTYSMVKNIIGRYDNREIEKAARDRYNTDKTIESVAYDCCATEDEVRKIAYSLGLYMEDDKDRRKICNLYLAGKTTREISDKFGISICGVNKCIFGNKSGIGSLIKETRNCMSLVESREKLREDIVSAKSGIQKIIRDEIWRLFNLGASLDNIADICNIGIGPVISNLKQLGVVSRGTNDRIDLKAEIKESARLYAIAKISSGCSLYDVENETCINVERLAVMAKDIGITYDEIIKRRVNDGHEEEITELFNSGEKPRDIAKILRLTYSRVKATILDICREPDKVGFEAYKKLILKFYNEGLKPGDIAERMCLESTGLANYMSKIGIDTRVRESDKYKSDMNEAIELVRQGYNYSEIASFLGCGTKRVIRMLDNVGINIRRDKLIEQRNEYFKDTISDMVKNGASIKQIYVKTGVSPSVIRKIVDEIGVADQLNTKLVSSKEKINEATGRIISMLKSGCKYKEIAAKEHVSKDLVYKIAKSNNLSRTKRLSEGDINKIVRLKQQGYKDVDISRITGFEYCNVRYYTKKYEEEGGKVDDSNK